MAIWGGLRGGESYVTGSGQVYVVFWTETTLNSKP